MLTFLVPIDGILCPGEDGDSIKGHVDGFCGESGERQKHHAPFPCRLRAYRRKNHGQL